MKEIAILLRKYYVYAHIDPITYKIRYIGKGSGKRAFKFTNRSRNKLSHYRNWTNKLKKLELKPIVFKIVENLTEVEALNLEKKIITAFKNNNIKLINYTMGGDGISGYRHTKESKLKMSISRKGKISPLKNRKISEAHKQNISKANTGKFLGGGYPKGHKYSIRKKVIDLVSGIVFDSATEAANCYLMNKSTLGAMLRGQNRNLTNLCYLDKV